ncbi:ATP-binding cassette domain-containing protein [Streptomyces kanamyceticus]|uniref:ATP-binding cassette domain-containing protein n=1 Tax=Streptomyces kanamyceticus TaxID=1967 RepID=A0A5J6G6L5_STRKN|nr:ATP-binding cassette domain-containing protein [Streptomyces kanamyceticus]QEU91380.1 ATP-binding cassette domain-containing protein [Streptomyces kanamyceticus]
MIQAIGLTSNPRQELPPAVDDVSFEARTGRVTALLGAEAAGKTTALRLMLELQQGRGITYFRGRPLHRIAHPSREVGVLLGEVPGHPARSVRGHLRMLCAARGVPVRRADDVLEVIGLVSLREQRLGTLSRGMDRRLGLGCALLADPHTLVLDGPAHGLSTREGAWLHGVLRAHARQGGTVLFTTDDPKEAARTADRVVTLEAGRLVADQEVADFARTRLRPRVAVQSPHAARLGALLAKEARAGRRSVEVVNEDGSRLSVYGSNCADVGETAYRHGILVHQLADEIGDAGPPLLAEARADALTGNQIDSRTESRNDDRIPSRLGTTAGDDSTVDPAEILLTPLVPLEGADDADHARVGAASPAPQDPVSSLPPPITVRHGRSPLRPLRYELRRVAGVGSGYLTVAAVLAVSALIAVFLARAGHTPQARLIAAWPEELPLPPAALGAGLLGALAFGDEFRHPALAADRGTVPRRLGLLGAKLVIAAAAALMLCLLAVVSDAALLHLVYGEELTKVPADWLSLSVSWVALVTGCAWAGVLAAGVFRSTTAGLAAVLAVPIVVVPLVQKALEGPSVRSAAGLPARLRDLALVQWPFGAERYLAGGVRMVAQPVGGALMLSLTALLCAYLLTAMRSRVR